MESGRWTQNIDKLLILAKCRYSELTLWYKLSTNRRFRPNVDILS